MLFVHVTQGYAVITVLRNNFDNGWIGFDERSLSHVEASEESDKPVSLTLRRESSMSFGQLTVCFAAPCILFVFIRQIRIRCHCLESILCGI